MRISDWSSDVCSSDLDLGRLDIAQERDTPSPQPCEMRRRAPAAAQIIAADRAIALLGQLRPPHQEAAFLLRELVELGEQRTLAEEDDAVGAVGRLQVGRPSSKERVIQYV